MKNLKKLTILHSNDMHGDFLAEQIDERLVGGVSLLSGYVNKVRREEKNVIYAVAGDMFRGSVIDSEYKGTSTIGIMNLVGPDVATIGNHEIDYGLAHLLFLEKCADFPIINANLHIKSNGRRMFRPFWIAHIDNMNPVHRHHHGRGAGCHQDGRADRVLCGHRGGGPGGGQHLQRLQRHRH